MARLKTLMVSQELWERCISVRGLLFNTDYIKELPEGAVLVNSFYDGDRACGCLTYRHESFPDLQEFQTIPRFTLTPEEVRWHGG